MPFWHLLKRWLSGGKTRGSGIEGRASLPLKTTCDYRFLAIHDLARRLQNGVGSIIIQFKPLCEALQSGEKQKTFQEAFDARRFRYGYQSV